MRPRLLHALRDPTRARVGLRQLPRARLLLSLFDDDYFRVLEPFHPEAEARSETAALRELLGLSQDDRILDLGCGWGRHLRLLLQAGHDVVGVDLSEALLRRAMDMGDVGGAGDVGDRRDPGTRGPAVSGDPPRLVAADMLRLPFRDARFDVVLNLATSLGLFLDDDPAIAALSEARRVLVPGGRLLLEGMHREDVEPSFAARDRWTLDDGTEVRARRRFDAARGISHEVLRWRGRDGRPRTKRHSIRIRTAAETARLLERAGFEPRETWGDWDGGRFHGGAERLIVLAVP